LKVISVNCKTETIFSTLDFEELVYKYMDFEAIYKLNQAGQNNLKENLHEKTYPRNIVGSVGCLDRLWR
jgi:hypothetical protein